MSSERMRLLTLLRPAMSFLPDVASPDRKVFFRINNIF